MVSLCVVAYVEIKRGKILDGLFDGAVWAIFLAGLLLFVLCQVGVTPGLDNIAIGLLVGSVVVGALTAGRHQKGFGKVTKGFGAVYGLINYMSDILSYARLYGLMLSGAQIAQIGSVQLAVPMLSSIGGIGGVIACVLIMFIGHEFNVAMGLLGAFIHDSRLQYVEFFSHFYTGDGELFAPLGSKLEHTYIEG
jgi:V/A-type H+-transporting ATPase subunit I